MVRFRKSASLAVAGLVIGGAFVAQAATVQWEGQSPIDIVSSQIVQTRSTDKITFSYQPETIVLTNTYSTAPGAAPQEWGTLKGKPASGPAFQSYITVNGEKYVLAQFHFHAQSEHAIDGVHSPMEVHFVHLRVHSNGEPYCIGEPQSLLVIGALIDEGRANAQLARIFDRNDLPADSSQPNRTIDAFDLGKVLPKGASYRYNGSLTAPSSVNCTTDVLGEVTDWYNAGNTGYNSAGSAQLEDLSLGDDGSFPEAVKWVVMQKHAALSSPEISNFESLFPEGNSRPVQESKGRVVRLQP